MHAVLIWCNVGSCRRVSGSCGCVTNEGIWCVWGRCVCVPHEGTGVMGVGCAS